MANTASKQVMISTEIGIAKRLIELWFQSKSQSVPPDLEAELETLIGAMHEHGILLPDVAPPELTGVERKRALVAAKQAQKQTPTPGTVGASSPALNSTPPGRPVGLTVPTPHTTKGR